MYTNQLHVLVVAGVRPQYIKCASLQMAISQFNAQSSLKIMARYINSGQHYDDRLSGSFIRDFDIKFDFSITHSTQIPGYIFGNSIAQISSYIYSIDIKPDWVIVFGDANSTLAGALAAKKSGIPVAHFEAGTAIQDIKTPEILNGHLMSEIAEVHFCSTSQALENLAKRGIINNVYIVGDIARDFVIEESKGCPDAYYSYIPGSYILITLHREENLNSPLRLVELVNSLSKNYKVVFVLHPRTKKLLESEGLLGNLQVHYVDSLSYREMLSAIKGSRFLVTDSGGLQREAYYLGKRCLVFSNVKFWPVLLEKGVHRQVDLSDLEVAVAWVEDKILSGAYPVIDEMDINDTGFRAINHLLNI